MDGHNTRADQMDVMRQERENCLRDWSGTTIQLFNEFSMQFFQSGRGFMTTLQRIWLGFITAAALAFSTPATLANADASFWMQGVQSEVWVDLIVW